MEVIELDLYNRLLNAGLFRENPSTEINKETKKVHLDKETAVLFENGVILGKWLLILKDTVATKNQNLNINKQSISNLKYQDAAGARAYNWNILIKELDNIGLVVDNDIKNLMIAGDVGQISFLFTRMDNFLKKVLQVSIDYENLNKAPQTPRLESYLKGSPMKEISQIDEKVRKETNKSQGKKKIVKDGVDIITMNHERELADTESTLELLLNSLCKAFNMKPKQAAALLTNNNQFLMHALVKGVKGKYEPLVTWYQDLYAGSKHMTQMLELEIDQLQTNNIVKILQTLACGLYSQSQEVCQWCLKLLTKIGQDFADMQGLSSFTNTWFNDSGDTCGLELGLTCWKKFPDLSAEFVAYIQQYQALSTFQLEIFCKEQIKKHFNSPVEYVNTITDMFPLLQPICSEDFITTGLIDYWLDFCIKLADNDGKHTTDERGAALGFIADLWLNYTEHIDQQEDTIQVCTNMIAMFKKGIRDKFRPLRVATISMVFRILEKFSEDKNPSAPAIYKSLIFSLCENPADSVTRQQYFSNFQSLFTSIQTIPIGLLIDPLIKQIQVSENVTYFYKTFDFQFFNYLVNHPKLQLPHAIQLLDLLAKIYLNDVCYSSAAVGPFIQICQKFIKEEEMAEFLNKFLTIGITMLLSLEKDGENIQQKVQAEKEQRLALANAQDKSKKILALPPPPKMTTRQPKFLKKLNAEQRAKALEEQNQEVMRSFKKSNIVQIGQKIQSLKLNDVNDNLRDLLLNTGKRFKELFGYYNKGIAVLLKWWGNPDQVLGDYIKAHEDKERREREQKERQERLEQLRLKKEQDEREAKEKEEQEKRLQEIKDKMALMNTSDEEEAQALEEEERRLMIEYTETNNNNNMLAIQDGSGGENQIALYSATYKRQTLQNIKALGDIEKIKTIKKGKDDFKKQMEDKKKSDQDRLNQRIKEQLEKRKIELGVSTMNCPNEEKSLVYKDGVIEKMKQQEKQLELPTIILLNLDQEEDRDKEAVNQFLRKYAKLWKYLYNRYANSGFSGKHIRNFDQLGDKLNSINMPEIIKLVKEHNVYPDLISKVELATLIRLVNTKIIFRNDISSLTYDGFIAFILQLAYFIFTRPPTDLTAFPPVETLQAFVYYLKKATEARGQATVLYDDPDTTDIGDKDLIKEINRRLQSDPSYPIPEGYYKLVEKNIQYEYKLPEQVAAQLPESSAIAIEVLDQVLYDIMDIHFLEPIVNFEEKLKIRPKIKNQFTSNVSGSAEALNYMNKVEKKQKPMQLNDKAFLDAQAKRKLDKEIKPKLSIALKLEVAKYHLGEQPFMKEVAEVLEEILQASEKGLKELPPRVHTFPGQLWNDAKQKNKDDKKTRDAVISNKEDKRMKRDQMIKEELARQQKEKAKLLEDTRQERDQKEKERKDKQKRDDDKKRRDLHDLRSTINEQKKQNMENIQKKREEEDNIKKDEEEKKKIERIEFMKKQKAKLQGEFNQIYQDRDNIDALKQENEQRTKEIDKQIKNEMESFIKESKQDRGQEMQDRQAINQFMQQQDVEHVFALYKKGLTSYYKFYCQQENKGIEFTMDKQMQSITFREFVRFGYQSNCVPVLIAPEDIVYAFRMLVRERIEEISGKIMDNYFWDKNTQQVLDFEYFQKGLCRLAVMAQDQLGGQKEDLLIGKLQEEQKKKEQEQSKKLKLKEKIDALQKEDAEEKANLKEQFEKVKQNTSAKLSKAPSTKNTRAGSTNPKIANKRNKLQQLENQEAAKLRDEDAFFQKWIKQREGLGLSIGPNSKGKRIIGKEKDLGQKGGGMSNRGQSSNKDQRPPIAQNKQPMEQLNVTQDQTEHQNVSQYQMTPTKSRKTKEIKELKVQEEKALQNQILGLTKVEKKTIYKPINVNIISAKTIEALMRFLEIQPDDSINKLNSTLNKSRIEIQGQFPTKVKKEQRKLDGIKEGTIGGGGQINTSNTGAVNTGEEFDRQDGEEDEQQNSRAEEE